MENLGDVGNMVYDIMGINENVIYTNNNKTVEHVSENLIHNILKNGRGTYQSEGHDKIFVVSRWGYVHLSPGLILMGLLALRMSSLVSCSRAAGTRGRG